MKLKLLALALFFASTARAVTYPSYVGYVNDFANVIQPDQKAAMETAISQSVKKGGWQIAVVTVPEMQGLDVESYANGMFRTWGIGTKEKNDGVLLLLSLNPRKIRIEVGKGIEGDLTDVQCIRIIRDHIVPLLKSGDIGGGLLVGVGDIQEVEPKILTPQEIEALKQQEIINAKQRKEAYLEQLLKEQEEARIRHTQDLQNAENWKHIKANIMYVLTALLLFSPIWGPLSFLFIRKKLREKAIQDEKDRIRQAKIDKEKKEREARLEAARKERERLAAIEAREEAARQRERERIAYEKEQTWRKANPEAAKEKDRKEAARRKKEAEEEAEREKERKARRKREEEEEEASRRRRNSSSSYGSSSSSSSSSGFGGFGGGSSSGGGASSSW